jgi:beta-lactam-binding protein with PASTA domain
MRRFLRILLLALVLLTVALISALTAMQLAIHGREVVVPKLVGMTPSEAEHAGAASGLQVVIERQFYSPDIPEGRIMTQMPQPGTKVRRGWPIRVAQSLGPQRVNIPDVTGGSERAAAVNVRRRGLALGSIAQVRLPDAPEDQVVSQSPPANASGVSAPKINLLVSAKPEPAAYVMPDLTGQSLGAATTALQESGMRVGKVSLLPPASAPGAPQAASAAASEPSATSIIVTRTPAPGHKVADGTVVNFEVR